mgnify:FL=1
MFCSGEKLGGLQPSLISSHRFEAIDNDLWGTLVFLNTPLDSQEGAILDVAELFLTALPTHRFDGCTLVPQSHGNKEFAITSRLQAGVFDKVDPLDAISPIQCFQFSLTQGSPLSGA